MPAAAPAGSSRCACGQLVVQPLGEVDRHHQRVRRQRPHRVACACRATPPRPPAPGTRRASPPARARAGAAAPARSGSMPAPCSGRAPRPPGRRGTPAARRRVRDVDRPHLVLVVEDRVHHVDRQLQLVDAAARPRRVELRVVASRPAPRSAASSRAPSHDVLRRGWSAWPRARPAPRRDSSSTGSTRPGSSPSSPPAAACRASRPASAGSSGARSQASWISGDGPARRRWPHAPAAVVEADHRRLQLRGVELRGPATPSRK